jgi:solute carrier family 35, member E3
MRLDCHVDVYAALYMSSWFGLSCGIAILNKFIFTKLDFIFPVTLTAYHMLAQSAQAYVILHYTSLIPKALENISTETYRKNVLPVASLMCVEILFNNMGLRYIPVSFVQTLRSLTPLCAALVARVVLGKKMTRSAALTLIPISIGVSLSTVEELSFHLGGFLATIMSCFLTAGKLTLSSQLMSGVVNLDPVSALLYMCPIGFLILSPIAVLVEGASLLDWLRKHGFQSTAFGIVLSSALFAFALNLSIFLLLRRTNAVAVAVAGNLKVIVTVVLSVLVFQNPLSRLGWIGCFIALLGCSSYGLLPNKFT